MSDSPSPASPPGAAEPTHPSSSLAPQPPPAQWLETIQSAPNLPMVVSHSIAGTPEGLARAKDTSITARRLHFQLLLDAELMPYIVVVHDTADKTTPKRVLHWNRPA